MTRINVSIPVRNLTDEHLIAEHCEIKRLPAAYQKALRTGALYCILIRFKLGTGHVKFFLDKGEYTLGRYNEIHQECIRRGFNVPDYSENWKVIGDECMNSYTPTKINHDLIVERITSRLQGSPKSYWHYEGKPVSKDEAIEILNR